MIDIRLNRIVKGITLRPISEAYLKNFVDDMRVKGQRDPITVQVRGSWFVLIDGAYRVTAARRLGWETIKANVIPDTDMIKGVRNIIKSNKPDDEKLKAIEDFLDNL